MTGPATFSRATRSVTGSFPAPTTWSREVNRRDLGQSLARLRPERQARPHYFQRVALARVDDASRHAGLAARRTGRHVPAEAPPDQRDSVGVYFRSRQHIINDRADDILRVRPHDQALLDQGSPLLVGRCVAAAHRLMSVRPTGKGAG